MEKQRNRFYFYLTVGFFLLAVCIALIALYISSGGKPLSTIDLGILAIWIIICGVAGLGCLIYALVTEAIYAFGHRKNYRKVKIEESSSKPSIRIDTADIAKMNSEQLATLKELTTKILDKQGANNEVDK